MTKQYFPAKDAVVDADGIPAAIVAIDGGEPLVLLVSEETMNKFNALKKSRDLTHIQLANHLKDAIWEYSGEFCEDAILEYFLSLERYF